MKQTKGGFPVIAETTRNHIFSKQISQVIPAAMVLAPNFCCKNCLRVVSALRGNPPLKRDSHSAEFLQWKRGSDGYLMLPGNGKINYVTLKIVYKNRSILASDR